MSEIISGRHYILIERPKAVAIAQRIRHLERLVQRMRAVQLRDQELLLSALVELGQARAERDPQWFANRWLKDHRREQPPLHAITIVQQARRQATSRSAADAHR